MSTRHTWTDRAKGIAWKIHSATRDTWHLVVLHPDGWCECTCEWWQNEGFKLKDCKHVAAVRTGAADLPRPYAVWTDDADYPTAREWADRIEALHGGYGCGRCTGCGYETPDHPGSGPYASDGRPSARRRAGVA